MDGPPASAFSAPHESAHRRDWWRRVRKGHQHFRFVTGHGHVVNDAPHLERIRRLAIPPAWQEVRISPYANSRLQAVGLDGSGRLQYLYHHDFRAHQERKKFEKIERFGDHMPRLREVTSRHIIQAGLDRERVLAAIVRLINQVYFRVGSERGVERYRTFGVTTLRRRHLQIEPGGRLVFTFDGKHHVHHRIVLVDEDLARLMAELAAQPGARLFKYRNGDGRFHAVTPQDVSDYLKSATDPEFSPKDFRTWAGTLIVAQELARLGDAADERDLKGKVAQAVRAAAERLGNTAAVCRRAYLHPVVLYLYERGLTLDTVSDNGAVVTALQRGHTAEESQLLELFHLGRALQTVERERGPIDLHRTHGLGFCEPMPEPAIVGAAA